MSEAFVVIGGDDDQVVPTDAVEEPPGVPVQFMGETFHLRPVEDYQFEMLLFADASVGGPDSELLAASAATLRLIRAALVDGEWPRFAALASRQRAQTKRDLMPLVVAIAFPTARPTPPPSDSSGGRPVTPENSGDELSSRVIAREEASGRPDRAQFVQMARDATDGPSVI
ncbi:hypothetical protein TEK04_19570 [Klenkia sp. LSe6-5]|uniref:Uncharacterized protein n=1 Tax=Klenkia sesuvii TaxID=3103137 RepID=A0ABU8DYM1_9ACTN